MSIQDVASFASGEWIKPDDSARSIASAITGEKIARAGNSKLNVQSMLEYARDLGGQKLRAMTFHDRARMLKALALYLGEHKQALYDASFATGATQNDHLIDIDGGIGTLMVFASKGRREMPDSKIYLDGDLEQLSRNGTFMGQHICTPKLGVGLHINAFNFPVWGMLEKLAPTILAGVPVIVKPATATCYVTELCVRLMLQSTILPKGALQLVSGSLGDMLEHLNFQDVVSFTGSADTALRLRSNPHLLKQSIPFIAEQDSLNASILAPDAKQDMPEFDLFIKEVVIEMTTKAGQKCTAMRRLIVPNSQLENVIEALKNKLSNINVGDPRLLETQMGALVSASQKDDVLEKASMIKMECEAVFGDCETQSFADSELEKGSFISPILFHCSDPDNAQNVHCVEAFGPVSTIMGYDDIDHAINLANKGGGSLVTSIITRDGDIAEEFVLGIAAYNGRLYFNNADSMKESTGHGSPYRIWFMVVLGVQEGERNLVGCAVSRITCNGQPFKEVLILYPLLLKNGSQVQKRSSRLTIHLREISMC